MKESSVMADEAAFSCWCTSILFLHLDCYADDVSVFICQLLLVIAMRLGALA